MPVSIKKVTLWGDGNEARIDSKGNVNRVATESFVTLNNAANFFRRRNPFTIHKTGFVTDYRKP
ncbi:MAG: hypothetical protein WBE28_12070 [bacterium]